MKGVNMASAKEYESAANKALELLNATNMEFEFGIDLGKFIFDLNRLLGKNICVKEVDFNTEIDSDIKFSEFASGFSLKKDEEEYFIVLNKDMPITRKRFTIAHELGHIFLGHLENKQLRYRIAMEAALEKVNHNKNDDYFKAEQLANAFAAELLMPSYQVKVLARKYSAPSLSRLYNVSIEAVMNRLKNLNIFGWNNE